MTLAEQLAANKLKKSGGGGGGAGPAAEPKQAAPKPLTMFEEMALKRAKREAAKAEKLNE
jgi:hypothetical protein